MGVVNRGGALYFASGIDNTGMYRDADETKRIVGSITEQVRRAGMVIGAVFGAQTLAQFGREIINVRGEMQMLEKSFEVLLGGSSGVAAFMKELKQFAVESPLSMTGVANAAQMLSAFGVEAENLIPVIRQLGDISMGNEEKFRSLALAYSQMTSAGKVLSQDLRQMATAGFNPLGEIARTTGRSIQDVTALMDSGKITVNQVTEAFRSATAEGGKFYGMTQKQAEGIKGLQAQIEGAAQEIFNNLGKNSEGFITGAYKSTIALLENYEKIGKSIAGVIGVLGVYKTAQIAAHAYDNVSASIKYIEEAKNLEALLTVEEKRRISVLNLKSGTEQHVKAIQAEIEARGQNLKAQVEQGVAETNALAQKRIVGKEAKVAASENVAARKAELAAIIGNAEAEKTVALQKKMLIESEKQSRAALLVNKLEEKKTDAIVQAQDLKIIGATEEKIAAKNREIATIHKKIIAAKEEEIQHARNVAALRSEVATVSGSVTSKKIESAEKKLNTAIIKENTVTQLYNNNVKELASTRAKTLAASQQLETLSTSVDTASKKTNITFTTLLTAAKARLATVAAKLNAVLLTNAWSIAIAGAAALTYGLYKLITYQTDAEKAQRALNDSMEIEKLKLDALIESLKRASPDSERYKQIKEDINSNYGEYLSNLDIEIDALRTSKEAYKLLSDEIENNTRSKLRNQFIDERSQELGKSIGGSFSSLRKRLTNDLGAEQGKQAFADIKSRIENATLQDAVDINKYIKTIFEESGKSFNVSASKYYQDVNSILSSKHLLKQALEEADDIFGQFGDAAQGVVEDNSKKTDAAIIKNKEYWKSVLDEASSARDKLGTDQVGTEEWERLTALINSASMQLDAYSTKLRNVKDNSKVLAPRDVGTVEGVGAGILESFMSSDVIDDVAARQMGEYTQKLRESLSDVDMDGVDIFDILTSDLWNKAFSDLDKMAVDDMIELIHQLELHWKKLNLDPTELAALRDRIEKITDEIGRKNPFKGLSEAIRKFKSGDGNFKDIAKNAGASLDQVGSMFNSITDGLVKMGAAGDEESQKMLKGIGEMVGGAATLAKGIATGNPADIIAGSVQLLTAAIDVFDKKSREANRTIKKNTEQVNNLQKAYENLERAISRTYSTKAASLIEDEQRNLEQQRRLIQDNIRAEQSKKKPDNKVINEWKNVLNDIDARLEENKDRILESLVGTDVMSAIDEFAQAYADAWASGESAAKKSADVVRGILRNALINYMKGQLQPEVDRLMNKIASSMQNDGRIDSAEKNAIDALVAVLDNKAAQYKNELEPYLDKQKSANGVTGELQAQMTEGTGSQLVGLWNMTAMDTRAAAMDTREIKEHLKNNPMPDVAKELYNMQNELAAINRNTRETADNTSHIEEGFNGLKEELSEIKKNTKQNNSRG